MLVSLLVLIKMEQDPLRVLVSSWTLVSLAFNSASALLLDKRELQTQSLQHIGRRREIITTRAEINDIEAKKHSKTYH